VAGAQRWRIISPCMTRRATTPTQTGTRTPQTGNVWIAGKIIQFQEIMLMDIIIKTKKNGAT